VTQKPPTPPIRALIDESEIDDSALDGVVGGRGAVQIVQGGADSWSRAVQDHAKIISASDAAPERQGCAQQAPALAVPASGPALKRALLPELTTDGPVLDEALPVVGEDVSEDVSSLFKPAEPRKEV
jgi:hypothetical protein